MSIEQEILKDLELLELYTPLNPRYFYYDNKIKTNIKRSFNKREISKESEKTLTARRMTIESKYNSMKLYNVFSEYNKYVKTGSFILKTIEMRDLLYCVKLCSKLLFINDETLSQINSDEMVSEVSKDLFTKVDKLMEGEDYSNNDLYIYIKYLFKCGVNCYNREPLREFGKVILESYFRWSYQLLENNREFYYSPRVLTKTLEDCDYYLDGSDSYNDQNNYFVYYRDLYTLKCEESYFFPKGNYRERQKEILSELEDKGLTHDLVSYIQISISNYISSIYEQDKPIDVILAMDYDNLEFICGYSSSLLTEASIYARNFYSCFNKSSLIKYCLVCSDLISNIDNLYINKTITYNEALEYHLKLLMDAEIITTDEYLSLYDDYRRE